MTATKTPTPIVDRNGILTTRNKNTETLFAATDRLNSLLNKAPKSAVVPVENESD